MLLQAYDFLGKTEAGAIWLSHRQESGQPGTSPYAYYQFWLSIADADVERYLKLFTGMFLLEIEELAARHQQAPHAREAQRALAQQATSLLHGESKMQGAEAAAKALFSGEVRGLEKDVLEEIFSSVPSTDHSLADLQSEGPLLVEVLAQTSLAKSKGEARKHLLANAISVNGNRAKGVDARLSQGDLLHGAVVFLRRGKKAWHVTRWQ